MLTSSSSDRPRGRRSRQTMPFLSTLHLPGLTVPLVILLLKLRELRCKPACSWVLRHFRAGFAKRKTWADVINSNKVCGE